MKLDIKTKVNFLSATLFTTGRAKAKFKISSPGDRPVVEIEIEKFYVWVKKDLKELSSAILKISNML